MRSLTSVHGSLIRLKEGKKGGRKHGEKQAFAIADAQGSTRVCESEIKVQSEARGEKKVEERSNQAYHFADQVQQLGRETARGAIDPQHDRKKW
jgi:hypothetical protein